MVDLSLKVLENYSEGGNNGKYNNDISLEILI